MTDVYLYLLGRKHKRDAVQIMYIFLIVLLLQQVNDVDDDDDVNKLLHLMCVCIYYIMCLRF